MANWLLPAPGFLEDLTDVPTAPTSAIETYAVASAIVKPTFEVQSAAQFLCGIDPTLTSVEKIIHGRCTDLFRARTGTLRAQEATPVAKFTSVQKLEEALQQGAVWASDPPRNAVVRCELREWPADTSSAHHENWASTWAAPVLPPLASKLYQESSLREPPKRSNV